MDRADAAPDARVGGAVPTGTPVRRRRGFVSRRAPVAGGPGRAVEDPGSRVPERFRADREAGPGDAAALGARGLVSAPRPDRGGAAARRGGGAGRPRLSLASDPRPADALGELLDERGDELQLAAAARACRDRRLRGRARGGAPRRAGPLAAILAADGVTLPRVARARGMAAPPWPRAAALAPPRVPSQTTALRGGSGRRLRASVLLRVPIWGPIQDTSQLRGRSLNAVVRPLPRLLPPEEPHRQEQTGRRPYRHDRRGRADVAPAAHDRVGEAVDQVLQRQRLRDR